MATNNQRRFAKCTGLYVMLPCINGQPPHRELLMVDQHGTLMVKKETGCVRTYMLVSEIVERFGPVMIECTMKASDQKGEKGKHNG